MLLTSSRHDRASRAVQLIARLVLGASVAAAMLLVALVVLNPGAAIFAAWGALLLIVCMIDRSRHRAKIEAGRRDRLRESARRASEWPS